MKNTQDPQTFRGISEREVLERLKREGYNELPSSHKRTFLDIIWEMVQEPIFLLLIACGVIYTIS